MFRKHLFTVGILVFAACPLFALDHFKFWKVHPIAEVQSVALFGQFDGLAPWNASVSQALYVANPTWKRHAGKETAITRNNLHYVAYAIRPVVRRIP
jgi:hypothetical protein